jgi:hypothetical protein
MEQKKAQWMTVVQIVYYVSFQVSEYKEASHRHHRSHHHHLTVPSVSNSVHTRGGKKKKPPKMQKDVIEAEI